MTTITVTRKDLIDVIAKELEKIDDETLLDIADLVLDSNVRIVKKDDVNFEYTRFEL